MGVRRGEGVVGSFCAKTLHGGGWRPKIHLFLFFLEFAKKMCLQDIVTYVQCIHIQT